MAWYNRALNVLKTQTDKVITVMAPRGQWDEALMGLEDKAEAGIGRAGKACVKAVKRVGRAAKESTKGETYTGVKDKADEALRWAKNKTRRRKRIEDIPMAKIAEAKDIPVRVRIPICVGKEE